MAEDVDPWLPQRLRAITDLTEGERKIEAAVNAAIRLWLTELRRLVLGEDETLTAAGCALVDELLSLEPGALTEVVAAGGMPSLEGFGDAARTWLSALRDLIRPAILDLFGERFLRFARVAPIGAQPYRDAYANQVFSRLRLFPAQEFETIRFEIAEALSEGEGIDQIRDRVAAQLDFDGVAGADGEQSASRGAQGRIDEVEQLLDADEAATEPDDPDELTNQERKALRAERRALYEEKRRLDQKWEWKARRIARTEAVGAMNAGDYSGALAAEQIEGRPMWKQWLATPDERTRVSHRLADGQVQPLREPFVVGGWPLEHPGDPVGPGHEVINCRCTALYIDSDELSDIDVDPANLPPPQGDPLVSPEQIAANAERHADRIEAMAELASGPPPDLSAAGGDMADALPDGWRGVLAPLDTKSGDGRVIATPSTLRVREAPRALLWQPALADYHGDAVVVGRIDRVWVEGGNLMGEGPFDLGDPDGQRAARQLGEGFSNGVSVDLDDFTVEEQWVYADGTPIPESVLEIADWDELWEEGAKPVSFMTDWRLMTATLVSQPAFDQARIEPVFGYVPADDADLPAGTPAPADAQPADDEVAVAAAALPAGRALVASLSGDTGLPVAPSDTAWNSAEAAGRIFERFTDAETGEVDAAAVAAGFLWVVDDADQQTPAAYMLGFADFIDDALVIVPAGAAEVGAMVADGVGEGLTEDDVAALRAAVCTLYDTIRAADSEWPDCPTAETEDEPAEEDAVAASAARRRTARPNAGTAARRIAHAGRGVQRAVITAAASPAYSAADFANPQLTGPTPLTVSDTGVIRGHLAIFGTCHTSFPDVCVTPPKSATNYALFHLGEVDTDAGALAVGKITLGTGHAGPKLGARPAAEHYDNTGATVGVVRAGEDEFGIWVAGHLVEDVPPSRVAALKRSPLSGDWRRVNGVLELVAALAVNTPGFPVPRSVAASAGGSQISLVAAGVVPRQKPSRRPVRQNLDPAEFARAVIAEQRADARRGREADALAKRLGVDHDSRAAAMAARIGVT